MLKLTNDDMKKAIIRSQHTQRNWDLEKQIPQEDIDLFIHSITQCPSKQNFAFYNAHVITDRSIIEQIHANSMGLGYRNEEGTRTECTNPQTLANMVVVFEEATMSDEYWAKFGLRDESTKKTFERDRDMAVGIAAGYLNVVASMADYRTGCCACYDKPAIKELLGLENTPVLIMGVGYPDTNRPRREHHVDNVMIPSRVKEEITTKIYE